MLSYVLFRKFVHTCESHWIKKSYDSSSIEVEAQIHEPAFSREKLKNILERSVNYDTTEIVNSCMHAFR